MTLRGPNFFKKQEIDTTKSQNRQEFAFKDVYAPQLPCKARTFEEGLKYSLAPAEFELGFP